jgi:5-methylcytosine-specific restriction endonuclease McrA
MRIKSELKVLFKFLLSLTKEQRKRFLRSIDDGLRCHYCQGNMDYRKSSSASYATWDHIIPKIEGGADTQENLVVACFKCNQKRGSTNYQKFMNEVRGARV